MLDFTILFYSRAPSFRRLCFLIDTFKFDIVCAELADEYWKFKKMQTDKALICAVNL